MVVKHCGEKIVCRTDCVEITGKVKVYVLHRNDLSISAACRTALYSENRTERGFTQSYNSVFAYSSESVCKTDSRRGLALACRSRRNCGNKNELAVFFISFAEQRKINLCLVIAVLLNIFFVNVSSFGNILNVFHFAALCNFNVGQICHLIASFFVLF